MSNALRIGVRFAVLAGAFALTAAAEAQAPKTAKPAPEELTGLKVGAKAPKFVLKDQTGKERSLDSLLEKGKVALVFYRSADW